MAIDPHEIELSDAQKRQLAQTAERTGKPWAELLNEAVSAVSPAQCADEDGGESFYDVMKKDGVIGIVKDAPADLSSNPKHMEGFGQSDNGTGSD